MRKSFLLWVGLGALATLVACESRPTDPVDGDLDPAPAFALAAAVQDINWLPFVFDNPDGSKNRTNWPAETTTGTITSADGLIVEVEVQHFTGDPLETTATRLGYPRGNGPAGITAADWQFDNKDINWLAVGQSSLPSSSGVCTNTVLFRFTNDGGLPAGGSLAVLDLEHPQSSTQILAYEGGQLVSPDWALRFLELNGDPRPFPNWDPSTSTLSGDSDVVGSLLQMVFLTTDRPLDAVEFVNKAYCVSNSADVVGFNAAKQDVGLPGVTVTKDADPTFTRTWTWAIDKTADQTDVIINGPTQSVDVNYEVTLAPTSTDSDHLVSGTITIVVGTFPVGVNSGAFTVSDDAAGTPAAVDCDAGTEGNQNTFEVTEPGTYTCSYSASTSTDGTNTATVDVVWDDLYDAQHTGTADYAFGDPTQVIDESVTVTDTHEEFGGARLCTAGEPCSFQYTVGLFCPAYLDYTRTNEASFTTNDTKTTGSDTWNVSVSCPAPPDQCTLTQGYWRTHSEQGPARWTDETWLLVGGPDAPFFQRGQSYLDALWLPPAGNSYYILAQQYIAAQLNQLSGAGLCSDPLPEEFGFEFFGTAEEAFNFATEFFADADPADLLRGRTGSQVREAAEILTLFNEGQLCQVSCTEDESSDLAG